MKGAECRWAAHLLSGKARLRPCQTLTSQFVLIIQFSLTAALQHTNTVQQMGHYFAGTKYTKGILSLNEGRLNEEGGKKSHLQQGGNDAQLAGCLEQAR